MRGLFVLTIVALSSALCSAQWTDLKVKWGFTPFQPDTFVSMPRTERDAILTGWSLDKDCSKINGRRYVLNGDRFVSLIYTQEGNIAGIASSIPKNAPFNFPSRQLQDYFVDEGDYYTITAYMVDPAKVCTAGADIPFGGDRLVFKGTTKSLTVPLRESQIESFWTKGKCFTMMGNHWWANVNGVPINEDMSSDEFFPVFLQYNSGSLNGFGWAFNFDSKSTRAEHPVPAILSNFFAKIPKFMSDPTKAGVLSTLHIYFDSTPQLNNC